MAYSKQTWTDDVSAVTGARMTHIEQGIYDNSLATDKINPSGTATTTAEIEEGQINDVIGFKSLKLKGQTSQYTTTGKNLLNLTNGTYTSNGITGVVNNGVITLNGTASENSFLSIPINLTFQANKSYAISANNTQTIGGGKSTAYACTRLSTAQSDDTEADVLFNVANNSIVITKTSETVYTYFRVRTGSGLVYNNFVIKPQIEQATSATSYEPYTGGIASPNPDFPQEVNNVSGYNVIEISNKNINSSTLEVGNISNGANTTDNNVVRSKDYIMVTPSTAYVFGINGTANKVVVSMYDENKVFLTNDGANGYASSNGKFTTYSNARYIRYRSYSADKSLFENGNIQIEKGTSATSFVAHQGNGFDIDLPVENVFDYTKSAFSTNKAEVRLIDNGFIAEVVTTTTSQDLFFRAQINDNLLVDGETYTISYEAIKGVRKPLQLQLRNRDGSYASKAMATSVTYDSNYGLFVVNNIFHENNSTTVEAGTIAIVKNIQVERGTKIHTYTPYDENPIELCKIGTYADYIYKKDGKWFKHNEVGKIVIDESYTWTRETSSTWVCPRFYCTTLPNLGTTVNGTVFNNSISNMATVGNTSDYTQNENVFLLRRVNNTNRIDCMFDLESVDDLKSILANENMLVYYGLITPIDEEITYAPLLRQLDELYNSGLYDVTNISQDNSSEAFILDLEACKNNINGIVEYIRR